MTTQRELALSLAKDAGFFVFPVGADKKPLTKNGFKDSTNDPEVIEKLWDEHPKARVGVHTGASGIVVLDIDVKGGKDGFDSLDTAWLDIPASFAYDSSSGKGRHIVYRAPKGRELNGVAGYRKMEGVDRRAGGSYVVWNSTEAPTSRELSEAPDWLCDEATLRTLDTFEGSLRDWYDQLVPGKPNGLVRRALDRIQPDMTHSEMVSAQHEAVRLGAEGNPGVPELLSALEDSFLNRDPASHVTPVEEWAYKFTEALVSGVQKYGALTERLTEMPTYSLAIVPQRINVAELTGAPMSKPTFSRMLHSLVRESADADKIASILWNAPATKEQAREWGIDFLYTRIEEAMGAPQPETENPALAEIKEVVAQETQLLTPEERAVVEQSPSFEDEYYEFARSSSEKANEKYHRAGAWACASMAFAFRGFIPVSGTDKMGLNLWTMVMGESSTGKTRAQMFRDQVLNAMFKPANEEDATGYNLGSDSSISGLHEALLLRDREPSFFAADEASGFFKSLSTKGGWQTGTDDVLSRWYEGFVDPSNKVRLKELRGKSALTSLTVQMYATPDRLVGSLTRDQFLSGFLARFQWVIGDPPIDDDSRFELQESDEVEDYDATPKQIEEISMGLTKLSLLHGSKPVPVKDATENGIARKRLGKAFRDMHRLAKGQANWDIIEPSVTRLSEAMRKVAALNALTRGDKGYTLLDALNAIAVAEKWFENLQIVAGDISQGLFQRQVQEMEMWMRSKGGSVTRPSLFHRFRNMIERDAREIDSRIDFMIASGMVLQVQRDGRTELKINE